MGQIFFVEIGFYQNYEKQGFMGSLRSDFVKIINQ